jgi:hypothetical protein
LTAAGAERRDLGLALLRTMIRIRILEEGIEKHFLAGDIPGFAHLSIGQEAVAAGTCANLRTDDAIASTHRGHGHTLAKGTSMRGMVAELFARSTGICKGKGGSMHIADFSVGMLGANGVVAGGFGLVAGAALSAVQRKTDQVAVCFFGDGATNRGPFHENLNLCAVWNLPAIFVLENNRYASTTSTAETMKIGDVALRAAGYGMPSAIVDGFDAFAVYDAIGEATARAFGRRADLRRVQDLPRAGSLHRRSRALSREARDRGRDDRRRPDRAHAGDARRRARCGGVRGAVGAGARGVRRRRRVRAQLAVPRARRSILRGIRRRSQRERSGARDRIARARRLHAVRPRRRPRLARQRTLGGFASCEPATTASPSCKNKER